jgi:hypothetical protein
MVGDTIARIIAQQQWRNDGGQHCVAQQRWWAALHCSAMMANGIGEQCRINFCFFFTRQLQESLTTFFTCEREKKIVRKRKRKREKALKLALRYVIVAFSLTLPNSSNPNGVG